MFAVHKISETSLNSKAFLQALIPNNTKKITQEFLASLEQKEFKFQKK